ncbi:hypothetical protein MHYP_G00103270 [Metynnis hypsauchen]
MKKRAAGTDHSETNQDDVLSTTVTSSTSRPAQAADSGAASAHTTVMVQNDGVTSTDQQEEHQYGNVISFRYTAATGCKRQKRYRSPGINIQSFDLNADPNAQDDMYAALQPTTRSSDDVYHTLAVSISSQILRLDL